MSDFLATMAAASARRVATARATVPLDEIKRRAHARPKRGKVAFHAMGFDIIAEIKRHAPSAGVLNAAVGEAARDMVAAQGDAYTRGGAAAISVLTEPEAFAGNLNDLYTAATSTPVPVMRKDFLVDVYQVYEARAYDAAGVLLIARLLTPESMDTFVTAAEQTRQFLLLEIFDKEELRTVESMINTVRGRDVTLLIGVNARDLVTLRVDTERFAALAPHLPGEFPLVAESGLESTTDICAAASLGYRVALVGSALMKSTSPARTVSQFVEAGRKAAKR